MSTLPNPSLHPDPFALLGFEPRPWIDPNALEANFTTRAAAAHPDLASDPESKACAARASAELTESYRTLKKISSRLGLLAASCSNDSPKVATVPEPWGDLLMRSGHCAQQCDRWLTEHTGARTTLEKAMAAAEGHHLLEALNTLREEIDQLEDGLIGELQALDAAWPVYTPSELASLRQRFAFAEKIRFRLQERFLHLAEVLT